MLVKLRRNWFGPDGRQYRTMDGLAELPETYTYPSAGRHDLAGKTVNMETLLPSDAEIVSGKGTLPEASKPKLPGFGAKPAHEQVLDQIPGAAPIHQIRPVSDGPITREPLSEDRTVVVGEDGKLVAREPAKPADPREADHTADPKNKVTAADLKRGEAVAAKVKDAKLDL